jgi:hypothetical protein
MLTDAAIHSLGYSHSGQARFGNTDFGREGMSQFFKFHHCNSVCDAIKHLDRSNPSPIEESEYLDSKLTKIVETRANIREPQILKVPWRE